MLINLAYTYENQAEDLGESGEPGQAGSHGKLDGWSNCDPILLWQTWHGVAVFSRLCRVPGAV